MMEKSADLIADWLIKCDIVKEEEKELYSYAVSSFFLALSPLLLAVGFGVLMGSVKQSVVLILPFLAIRKFSGGYHTRHLWSCLLCSGFILPFCLVISFYWKFGWQLALVTVIAAISLIIFSPIEHYNNPLSQSEKKRYKKITAILTAAFLCLIAVCAFRRLYIYAADMSIGIILSAGLQLPCLLKFGKHGETEGAERPKT